MIDMTSARGIESKRVYQFGTVCEIFQPLYLNRNYEEISLC